MAKKDMTRWAEEVTEIQDGHELDAKKQDPIRNMKQEWQDHLMGK